MLDCIGQFYCSLMIRYLHVRMRHSLENEDDEGTTFEFEKKKIEN